MEDERTMIEDTRTEAQITKARETAQMELAQRHSIDVPVRWTG